MLNNEGYLPLPKAFGTISIHAGQNADQWNSLALIPPIVTSAIFVHKDPEKYQKYIYGRSGNPTRDALQKCLASIEGAEYSLCFSSGLSSLTTLLSTLTVGDHIITCDDMYGGNFNVLHKIGKNSGLEITIVDSTILTNIENAIKSNTKLIFLETPSNPTFKITDLRGVAKLAKQNNILLAVDNTIMTPYFQRPLDFGADLCIYSLSKYINGHFDVIMGSIVTRNKTLYEKLHSLQLRLGNIPSSFDCALVTRGLKTLAIRMRQHHENSIIVAKFLETHPRIKKVLHPGLPSHPQHELFRKQASGHCGLISVYIKDGREDTLKFIGFLKLIQHAGSLGGPETLIARPISLMSEGIPTELKKSLNITENLVRISVGLEDVEDIIEDLKQALDAI